MQPSPWLYAFLKSFEQFRPTAYKPTRKDVWTIGYGHTHNVREGDCCTMDDAERFLNEDVRMSVDAVSNFAHIPLTQNQFDALVSFTFNIGAGALATSTLLKKLNAGDISGAAAEFAKWDKQAGVELMGLRRRREAERDHFNAEVVSAASTG